MQTRPENDSNFYALGLFWFHGLEKLLSIGNQFRNEFY